MTAHSGSFFSADDCLLRRCFDARRRPRGATLLKPKDCLYHSIGDSRVGDRVRIRYPAGASRLTGVASKGKATVSLSRTGSHCPWRSLPNGIAGTPGRIRTCDLLLRRLGRVRNLVDFAARLATLKYQKARQKLSSGTDLVLVWSLPGRNEAPAVKCVI